MSTIKPRVFKGARDFLPEQMLHREHIMNIMRKTFKKYGFAPLETPAIEYLNVLSGKYGDEADKLIYRLNYKPGTKDEAALHYDLTVPFSRVVAMNPNLPLPFKRYQMQPVWRADRPQKGRYREFMQCDADVIGSDSLIHEAELLSVYAKVFKALAIPEINILVNNRKVLSGLAEKIKAEDKMMDMTIAIDKLDKIGWDGVKKELTAKDFDENQVQTIQEFIAIQSEDNQEVLAQMEAFLSGTENGQKGIEELKEVMKYVGCLTSKEEMSTIKIQFSLARGLNYYTGFIVEVMTTAVKMGSIAGGGRYDDLTGLFGLKNMSGVGISFGIDRIYDVLEELDLFPPSLTQGGVQVLFLYLEEEALPIIFEQMQLLRAQGISAELYARKAKMGNQMKFADRKQIGNVVIIGSQELQANQAQIRNMKSGEQTSVSLDSIASFFKS